LVVDVVPDVELVDDVPVIDVSVVMDVSVIVIDVSVMLVSVDIAVSVDDIAVSVIAVSVLTFSSRLQPIANIVTASSTAIVITSDFFIFSPCFCWQIFSRPKTRTPVDD
jgi:hypothetical protein